MYFNSPYVSNSDLKELVSRHEGRSKPDNIQDIYDFGTQFHSGILEPHKAIHFNEELPDIQTVDLLQQMHQTFWADELCRSMIMLPDFRREHEFYRENVYGLQARCKMDGSSRKLDTILELKGLSITTNKAFLEAVDRFDYDQGAAWYLDVTKFNQCLIVGISKKEPDRMFKLLIDRHHQMYKSGVEKIKKAVSLWKMLIS